MISEGDREVSYWLTKPHKIQIKKLVIKKEIAKAFDTFLELRSFLTDVQSFVNQVIDQQKDGYKIVVCIGFRIMRMLSWGRILYIDGLITKEKWRGRGYGKILLNYVTKIAKDNGCDQIHLDSGYTRYAAHKVYLKHGFEFHCHHLMLKLK
jgi:GNAT superfamily N-acetyltransferase